MSEWRADPLSGEWTLVADELPLRRRDFVVDGVTHVLDAPCPLCEGHEATAGREIFAVRGDTPADGPGWSLRVVPNHVPALRVEADGVERHDGLLRHRSGLGAHEVVIESAKHDHSWFTMSTDELTAVFDAWRRRMADLRHDARLRAAVAVKNHGAEAGARLAHPHSQILALPLVPPRVQREVEVAHRHLSATGRCLVCDVLAGERASRLRLVADLGAVVAVAPFASRVPFEVWIAPSQHAARYDEAPDALLRALAEAVHTVLMKMAAELESPAFHAVILSAPFDEPGDRAWHWRLEILPRVVRQGGVDLGLGVPVNPVAPERAARVLRVPDRRLDG